MRTERFTQRATEAIVCAQQLAEAEGHPQLEVAHLLLALVEQPDGVVPAVLERIGADPAALAGAVATSWRSSRRSPAGAADPGNEARRVLSDAHAGGADARRVRLDRAPPAAAIIEARPGNPAAHPARAQGIEAASVLEALTQIRGNQRVTSENPEATYEALEKYGRDLTEPPQGQARPGHRPRRGDPPRHPGAQPPDQEQPGAHRRARRRQDGHRRGASPSGSCAATCPRA